ncbi:unnamed protein product [Musa acuminata subsp. malaccensis]|uniref:(wild Malaysian banana) hypothetical protein n=1 Tax=Musa acuminata subsp. malaccensis TaxID=214687 RepID=A0A804IS19_MUSAM|nr:unnamed protein product [Musa acuminata subsp. malaccensis]
MERLDGGAVGPGGGVCPPFHRQQVYTLELSESKFTAFSSSAKHVISLYGSLSHSCKKREVS